MLWSDEKLFTVQVMYNHQNDQIYAVNREDIPLNERMSYERQKPLSVLFLAGVTSAGEITTLMEPHLTLLILSKSGATRI